MLHLQRSVSGYEVCDNYENYEAGCLTLSELFYKTRQRPE